MPWTLALMCVLAVLVVAWTWRCHTMRRDIYSNSRTVFWATFVQVAGVLVAVWDFAGPILVGPEFRNIIPQEYMWLYPLTLVVLGQVFKYLRKVTTKSLDRRRNEP